MYKISTQNRDDISEQVLRILETSSNYGIVRLDVKEFYESIKLNDILKEIKNDNLLSSKSFYLIDSLKELKSKGLPRGLSVSPVLSEIFMRNIDIKIKEISGVYYYSRYVDDIFVLSTLSSKLIHDEIKKFFFKL